MLSFGRRFFGFMLIGLIVNSLALGAARGQNDGSIALGEALDGLKFEGQIHSIGTRLGQDLQNGARNDVTGMDVNSVELIMTSSPARAVDASVTWLYEEELGEDPENFAVDQAYVVIAGTSRVLVDRSGRGDFALNPFYLKAGKFYQPFTTSLEYHTFDVISEPQTLALSETLESGFQLGYTPNDLLNAHVGLFEGAGADGARPEQDADDLYAGVEYDYGPGTLSAEWMNNLSNTIALTEQIGDSGVSRVGGIGFYGDVEEGPVRLQASHVRAIDEFENLGAAAEFDDRLPSASTVELTYQGLASIRDHSLTGTLVYERTDEWPGHPEDVYGGVVDVPVLDGVTGSFEYLQRNYGSSASLDREELVALQLAVGLEQSLSGAGE